MKKIALILCLFFSILSYSQGIEVGFQSSFPSYGPSVKFPLSDSSKGQIVLGSFGTVTSISGRFIKALDKSYEMEIEGFRFEPYAYGQLGSWSYNYNVLGIKETAIGYGAGVGANTSLLHFLSEDLNLAIEFGLGGVGLEYYTVNAFSFGIGVHYSLKKK
jgi:hypothetical protein